MSKFDFFINVIKSNFFDFSGEASLRRMFCMEVVSTFQSATNNFGLGDSGKVYVYDGTSALYLTAPMKLDAGKVSFCFLTLFSDISVIWL